MEKLRFMSIIAVLGGFMGAALMFIIGAAKSIKAFQIYFLQVPLSTNPPPPPRLDFTDQAMLSIVDAMDAFLVALVLLIFAFGVYNLFIGEVKMPDHVTHAPWAGITTIGRLKQVLVEVVLVVLGDVLATMQIRVRLLPPGCQAQPRASP